MGTPVITGSRVLVTTTSTGTGTYQLGAAVAGHQTPAQGGVASGARVPYVVVDSLTAPTQWEEGEGVYTTGSPDTLTRALVRDNHLGTTAAVNWGSGTKYIFLILPPARVPLLDTDGWLGVGTGTAAREGHLHLKDASAPILVMEETGVGKFYQVLDAGRMEWRWAALGAPAAMVMTPIWWSFGTGGIQLGSSAISAESGAGNAAFLRNGTSTVATLVLQNTGGGTAYALAVLNDGGALVGSISNNGFSTTYNTTSDARLKQVLGPLDDAGGAIDALVPVRFAWAAAPEVGEQAGFLAQDAAQVVPGAVAPGRGAPGEPGFVPWQMDLSRLVPFLWAEVRALRARVAALETAAAGGGA